MANEREVVFKITADASGAERTIAQIEAELRQATAAAKSAALGSDEYFKALKRVGSLRTELTAVSKELKGVGTDTRNSLGGINENVKLTERSYGELLQIQKQLRREVDNLSTEQIEANSELAVKYREVNEAVSRYNQILRGQASFQNQVAAAIEKANAAQEKTVDRGEELAKILAELRRQQNAYADKASTDYQRIEKAAAQVTQELQNIQQQQAKANSTIGKLSKGFGQAQNAVKGFGLAIAATGIGALIQLIGQAITFLQRFDTVNDLVARGLAAVEVVIGRLFEGIKQVLTLDIEGFGNNLLGIADAVAAVDEQVQKLDEVDDALRDFALAEAEANRQIREGEIAAKDRTKTDEARLAILDRISALETATAEREIALLRQRRDALKATALQQGIVIEQTKEGIKFSGENQKAIEELIAAELALTNALAETGARQERINNRRNALLQEQEDARRKQAEAAAKAAEEARRKEEERTKSFEVQVKLRIELVQQEAEEARIAALERQASGELNEKEYQATLVRITAQAEQRKLEILAAAQLEAQQQKINSAELDKQLADQSLAVRKDEATRQLAVLSEGLRREQEVRQEFARQEAEQIAARTEAFSQLQQDIATIQSEGFAQQDAQQQAEVIRRIEQNQALLNAFGEQEDEALRKFQVTEEQRQEIAKKTAQVRIRTEIAGAQAVIAANRQVFDNFAQLLGEQSAAGQAFAAFSKTLTLFQIGLDTAEAISSLTLESNKNPLNGLTGGVAGFVQFATGLARILANIAQATQIVSGLGEPKAPKFASGGILQGPSHSAGGIKTPYGELEGGEAVINKRSTAMFAPILSAINQAGGGRALQPAVSVSVPKFATGGILPTAQVFDVTDEQQRLRATLETVLRELPSPQVAVRDINEAQQLRAAVVQRNSF